MVGDLFQFLKISLPKGVSCEGGGYFIVSNGNPYWVTFSLKSCSWAEKITLWKKQIRQPYENGGYKVICIPCC